MIQKKAYFFYNVHHKHRLLFLVRIHFLTQTVCPFVILVFCLQSIIELSFFCIYSSHLFRISANQNKELCLMLHTLDAHSLKRPTWQKYICDTLYEKLWWSFIRLKCTKYAPLQSLKCTATLVDQRYITMKLWICACHLERKVVLKGNTSIVFCSFKTVYSVMHASCKMIIHP